MTNPHEPVPLAELSDHFRKQWARRRKRARDTVLREMTRKLTAELKQVIAQNEDKLLQAWLAGIPIAAECVVHMPEVVEPDEPVATEAKPLIEVVR